ncbi:hypothetical protein O3M35_004476 [Rhynocoris fuscipes]|uniref:RAP domain-containing protein n=1 Tax=Rhynocoris fuscipes TaxID=488301 RepID=A0AAW1CI76_9HEMI
MFKVLSNSFCYLKNVRNLETLLSSVNFGCRNFSYSTKDVIVGDRIMPANPDILLKNMKSASDISDILMSVKMHHAIMNNRHLMQAFRSIFLLQKNESSNMSNGEIVRSAEFKQLCQTLKSHIRNLDIDDRVEALKTLSYLGVPATSHIVQIVLQSITKEVNELSLQQIIFFDFLLKDFQSCPLVDALKIALPIVFEANLKLKLDPDSLSHLTDLLHYASRRNLTTAATYLIDIIMKKRSEIDFKCAKSLVRSLCDLHINDTKHRPLLHQCLDVLVENNLKCTYQDYNTLLSKLVTKFSLKNNFYYHEEFMNSAINFIINNDAGFIEGIWMLRRALKYGHISIELLDYLLQKIEKDFSLIENCSTLILFTIISGLAQADYRPVNWSVFEPLILKNALSHLNQIKLPWMKFARDLAVLDCWSFELFQTIFSDEFLEKNLAREYNLLDYLLLLSLYQAVKTLCPWYVGIWPPDNILDKAIKSNGEHITEYPLLKAISHGFGGERYVLNGVHSKLGHFIDHVLMLRKGGYAVPFDETLKNGEFFIEDLLKNDEYQVLAILYLPSSAFTINTNKLRGSTRLVINTLEVCGPTVIHVNSTNWEQLLDSEEIPYIMNLIKEKTNT